MIGIACSQRLVATRTMPPAMAVPLRWRGSRAFAAQRLQAVADICSGLPMRLPRPNSSRPLLRFGPQSASRTASGSIFLRAAA